MTIQECYAAMGANYDDVLGRLSSERLVKKFMLKFLDDTSYERLCASLDGGDLKEAFMASHTIKGVCQNLGFKKLGESSHDLTEALRAEDTARARRLFERVAADYAETINAIRAYKEQEDGR